MAQSRKKAQEPHTDATEIPPTAAVGGDQGSTNPQERQPGDDTEAERAAHHQPSKLELAQKKLERMEETNKICFKHQDDLGRIEDELAKFKYTPAELADILEPKGRKMIPGLVERHGETETVRELPAVPHQ